MLKIYSSKYLRKIGEVVKYKLEKINKNKVAEVLTVLANDKITSRFNS